MENRKTYYQLILDRSGSMSSCIEETIAGVNSQVRRIKEIAERFPQQELYTSLCLFNSSVTRAFDRLLPDRITELSYADYRPSGNTALYDAVGESIEYLQRNIGHEVERNEASVVVVIFTDGRENASRQFSHRRLSSLIKELEDTDKWTFSYVGATIDAVDIAVHLNIRASNAMRYGVEQSVQEFNNVSDRMENYMWEKCEGRISKDFLKKKGRDQ
jgi:hypothetical protein